MEKLVEFLSRRDAGDASVPQFTSTEKEEIISTLKISTLRVKGSDTMKFSTMVAGTGENSEGSGDATDFSNFFVYREPEKWELNIMCLEKGEWGEYMEDEAFKRWKHVRPSVTSIFNSDTIQSPRKPPSGSSTPRTESTEEIVTPRTEGLAESSAALDDIPRSKSDSGIEQQKRRRRSSNGSGSSVKGKEKGRRGSISEVERVARSSSSSSVQATAPLLPSKSLVFGDILAAFNTKKEVSFADGRSGDHSGGAADQQLARGSIDENSESNKPRRKMSRKGSSSRDKEGSVDGREADEKDRGGRNNSVSIASGKKLLKDAKGKEKKRRTSVSGGDRDAVIRDV